MLRAIFTLAFLGLFVTAPAWAQKPSNRNVPSPPATRITSDRETISSPAAPPVSPAPEKPPAKPQPATTAVLPSPSAGELKATPEMWFYEQYMRQYQDPKMAVRASAEFRADQRHRRLASMQWFGLSNSRPQACPDPFHADWSPGWKSNNLAYPYRWNGVGTTWYVARPEPATVYTY
jgi:hypothetical protein